MKLVIANLKMNLLFSDIKKYKSKLEDANLKDTELEKYQN